LVAADFNPTAAVRRDDVVGLLRTPDAVPPLRTLNTVAAAVGIAATAPIFDPRLVATQNHTPVGALRRRINTAPWRPAHVGVVVSTLPGTPFGRFQAPLEHLLLVRRRGSEEIEKCVLLSDQESHDFYARLSQQPPPPPGEIEYCLYDPRVGVIAQSQPGDFDDRRLRADRDLTMLCAQAMFFTGKLTYTRAETEAIQHWITTGGAQRQLHTLLTAHILPQHPEMYPEYQHGFLRAHLGDATAVGVA
jgi:hypothetical protein